MQMSGDNYTACSTHINTSLTCALLTTFRNKAERYEKESD